MEKIIEGPEIFLRSLDDFDEMLESFLSIYNPIG